jgi:hypothetical protein
MSAGEILTSQWPGRRLLDPKEATQTCLLAEIVCRFGTSVCDDPGTDGFFREYPTDNLSKAFEHVQCGICCAGANITHDGSQIIEIAELEIDDVPSLLVCTKPPDEGLV